MFKQFIFFCLGMFSCFSTELKKLPKKKKIKKIDHLNQLPLPWQWEILDFVASDATNGKRDIGALACTNKYYYKLCCALEQIDKQHPRPDSLEKIILSRMQPTEKNLQIILALAKKHNDQKKMKECYESIKISEPWYEYFYTAVTCGSICCLQEQGNKQVYQRLIQEKYGFEITDEMLFSSKRFENYDDTKNILACLLPCSPILCLVGLVCVPCIGIRLCEEFDNECFGGNCCCNNGLE